MAVTVYTEKDCNIDILKGKKVVVIGFGSQGHAHALNLFDSGVDVTVGLREGSKTMEKVRAAGLKADTIANAVKDADVVMILIPDESQGKIYAEQIEPNLKEGAYLGFGHGFNVLYNIVNLRPDLNVFLAAPKGPGHMVRRTFVQGTGTPGLIAIEQDPSGNTKEIALAWAQGFGGARAGVIETTFKEETETDLFGEQAVLCGGVTELMKAGFETLVEAGYEPEMAYFECVHEMKLIVDMIIDGGFTSMRDSISNTAEYGDYITGTKVITKESREGMKEVLKDIQDGTFARNFIKECETMEFMNEKRKTEQEHQVEKVGNELRGMMSWLKK